MVPESAAGPGKSTDGGSSAATKKTKKKPDSDPTDDDGESGTSCRFPLARVRRLVRSADPAMRTAPDSIFLINKASEMFLEKLAADAFHNMAAERKKLLHYNHVASSVQNKKRYEFLSDFVPAKVRAKVALQEQASLSDPRP